MVFLKKKKVEADDEEFGEEYPEFESDRLPELGDNVKIDVWPEKPPFPEPKTDFDRQLMEGKNYPYCHRCKTYFPSEGSYAKCPICHKSDQVEMRSSSDRYRYK